MRRRNAPPERFLEALGSAHSQAKRATGAFPGSLLIASEPPLARGGQDSAHREGPAKSPRGPACGETAILLAPDAQAVRSGEGVGCLRSIALVSPEPGLISEAHRQR